MMDDDPSDSTILYATKTGWKTMALLLAQFSMETD
jgi:hypothetical protein